MEPTKKFSIDDLPEGCRPLAELIGLETFLLVAEAFGGEMLYIPNLNHLRLERRNRAIRAQYQAGEHEIRHLSRKYALSPRQIRNIVRREN